MFKRVLAVIMTVALLSTVAAGCSKPSKKPAPKAPPKKTVQKTTPRTSAIQTPATQPATPTTPGTATTTLQKYEKRVVELVNIERQKVGHDPLVETPLIDKGATAKATDMKDKRYFGHTSPTYGSPFAMMKTFGVHYQRAGENIASGYKTPETVVKGWMNSPGHRANILSTKYGKIGVGYAAGGKSGAYWVQWFTN